MTDYNNGQIHGWNGGECPVQTRDHVAVWCRSGVLKSSLAGAFSWDHAEARHFGRKDDIIAFRVVKQHVEPKVIWVNEYADGPVSFNTENSARSYAMPSATRIAVKYVEVVDDKEVKE